MDRLLSLSKSQWFLPVLALMAEAGGARVAVLRRRLGFSHSMAKRTVEGMIAAGWIMPNPGHGHPLRPDIILTGDGAALAPKAAALIRERERLGLPVTGVGKWHLPILSCLTARPLRFGGLQERLVPVTPRALTQQIARALDARTIRRSRDTRDARAMIYAINDEARHLGDQARSLAAF